MQAQSERDASQALEEGERLRCSRAALSERFAAADAARRIAEEAAAQSSLQACSWPPVCRPSFAAYHAALLAPCPVSLFVGSLPLESVAHCLSAA